MRLDTIEAQQRRAAEEERARKDQGVRRALIDEILGLPLSDAECAALDAARAEGRSLRTTARGRRRTAYDYVVSGILTIQVDREELREAVRLAEFYIWGETLEDCEARVARNLRRRKRARGTR